MMMRTAFALACAAMGAGVAYAQDMRGKCVGCGDEHRKCEFQCLLPSYRANTELAWPYSQPQKGVELSSCLTVCAQTRESCSETSEATNCLSCTQSCATTHEAEMLACLQKVDATTTLTFGTNLDACSVASSSTHDSCTESCHGSDEYYEWSPEAEEGLAVTSKFTIPGYRASLKKAAVEASGDAAGAAAKTEDFRKMEAPPVAAEFAAAAPEDAAAGGLNQWYLLATGSLGLALVAAGSAIEHAQGQRPGAFEESF